jgi:hypothetical protein
MRPDPTPETPGTIVRRYAKISFFVLLGAASLVALARFYGDEFHGITGEASWLWSHHRIAADEPEAFFVTREFELADTPRELVHVRVAADPEYTLWFNGIEIGGGTWEGPWLDRYDVTALARPGRNRIVLAARSPRGVGGVLASVDTGSMKRNWLVSDRSWRLHRRWSPELLARDLDGGESPRLLGRPPFGRWNWLEQRPVAPAGAWPRQVSPVSRQRFATWLPKVEVKSGVAVAGRVEAEAEAFDFGTVRGRAEIEVKRGPTRAIRVRYAHQPEELERGGVIESFVIAEGEQAVAGPAERTFRYLIVYDEPVEARVITR